MREKNRVGYALMNAQIKALYLLTTVPSAWVRVLEKKVGYGVVQLVSFAMVKQTGDLEYLNTILSAQDTLKQRSLICTISTQRM